MWYSQQLSVQCSISANGFGFVWKWDYPNFLWPATLNQINVTNMFKFNKNASETSKNAAMRSLQLTLNKFSISIHYSIIKTCAATTQINSTIHHSFLSCQPLVAPQNISTTRTRNLFYDPHWIFNFSNRGIKFWYLKIPNKIWIKRCQNNSLRKFWINWIIQFL